MVLPQLLPSIYTHIERSSVCKHESPSPTGGGLGWGYSRRPLCLYRNPVYIRLERSSVCKQESPSPAGRSPQRGRVGVGVSDIVGESKAHFSRLPPSPAISLLHKRKTAGGCRSSCYRDFRLQQDEADSDAVFASVMTWMPLPPPQPSPAAGFALRGRGKSARFAPAPWGMAEVGLLAATSLPVRKPRL